MRATLIYFVAIVWLVQGLYSKLLGGVPRHLAIVQSIPGLAGMRGQVVLMLVGVAEVLLAGWIVSGVRPLLCAAMQTAALLGMNAVELTWARPHLLWPLALLPVNFAFLSLAWTAAIRPRASFRHVLQRHPLPVVGHFDSCLVLTYAFPAEVLAPLVPPGLALDTHNGLGFVAVAMVQTRGLRPSGLPAVLGQNFFLAGYRVFVKFRRPGDGRTIRGLRILRSDTDRRRMMIGGNLLTHYNYRKCDARVRRDDRTIELVTRTADGVGDVHVVADVASPATTLPAGSPFTTFAEARRFAGPLPFTFDYEPQTHAIIAIRGVRENWNPIPVRVDVRRLNFFNHPPFRGTTPVLAAAFCVRDIAYRWERGVRYPLATGETTRS